MPGAKTFNSPGFHTASNLIPDVTYTLSVFAVLNGEESTPASIQVTTTPDGKPTLQWEVFLHGLEGL